MSSLALRSVPRIDDHSSLVTLYTSPLALGRSRWPDRASTVGFSPRSFPVAGPLAWNSLPPELKTTSLTLGCSTWLKTEMQLLYVVSTRQCSRRNLKTCAKRKFCNRTELNWRMQQRVAYMRWKSVTYNAKALTTAVHQHARSTVCIVDEAIDERSTRRQLTSDR